MASDTAMASTTLATTFSELQTQDAQFLQILVIQVPWLKRRLKPSRPPPRHFGVHLPREL